MDSTKVLKTAVAGRGGKRLINPVPLYAVMVALFVLYLLFQHVAAYADILGVMLFVSIIATIAVEVSNGVKEFGLSRNLFEFALVVLAVIVVWLLLRLVLHTPYPLDVVPSCSMLPTLQRGSMILLQGQQGGIAGLRAPVINITRPQYEAFIGNISREYISCMAYNQTGNTARISQYMLPGYRIGLYAGGVSGGAIVQGSYQDQNLVKYMCGSSTVRFSNGTEIGIAATTGIIIANTTILGDANNSVVVYETDPHDLFYREGDSYIVHRLYAILNVSGAYYFLTKGDNNPGLDIQYGNLPANITSIKGRVLASVPYLGYLKLILSNSFSQPQGCNSTILH
jgi:hypothetical protein